MNSYISRSVLLIALGMCTSIYGQDLGTKVVDVVKSYTPTIADAYKKREDASLKDSLTLAKQPITYSIYSVPVASTFVPEKGKANTLARAKKEVYNNSYAALGFGNNTTLYGDVSLSVPVNAEGTFGVLVEHLSSDGNVKNVIPDNNFSRTGGVLKYDFLNKDIAWGLSGNAANRTQNWYGMAEGLYTDAQLLSFNNISQSYFDYGIGGYVNLHKSVLKGVELSFSGLSDDYDTSEFNFRIVLSVEVPIGGDGHKVHANLVFDYLSTDFKQSWTLTEKLQNQWMLFGVNPSYQFSTNGFDLKLGAMLMYASAKDGENEFNIYPDVEASYRLLDEYAIVHAGVKGGLQQNTFSALTKVNPFVSPTLVLAPTDVPMDVFVGLKGKIDADLFYKIRGGYRHYATMPLFTTNDLYSTTATGQLGYQYNNSFGVVYDKVNEVSFAAGLEGNVERIFFFDLEGKYASYGTDGQAEAWNLSNTQLSLYTDVKITEALFAGADIFYVGSRNEKEYMAALPPSIVSLDAYFDLNLHADYTIGNKWTIFAKANNLFSKNYQRWIYYPVQGLQVLGGVRYQFKL
ncbi:MAG: TonB-dependent receptor [Capnocytophaga sp.]|nr:TonB-dependent receptor [Capnocytophaga sp.]